MKYCRNNSIIARIFTIGLYLLPLMTFSYLLLYYKAVQNTGVHTLNLHELSNLNRSTLGLGASDDDLINKSSSINYATFNFTTLKPSTLKMVTNAINKKRKKSKSKVLKELKLRSSEEVQSDLKKVYELHNLSSVSNCSDWNITAMPPYTRICKQREVNSYPLLTLFTTMHFSTKEAHVTENTLRLWGSLGARVKRILFVTSPVLEIPLIKLACSSQWEVITAPLCYKNYLPVLKSMFLAAQQIQHSTFYGYANSDILFDESLLGTLDFLKDNYLKHLKHNLLVGRRTNIKLQKEQKINDLAELRRLAENGTDGWVAAVDYFISSRDGFDWSDIPKVVIGRVAYDNWMIRHAISKKFAVIDITNSSLSAHQVGQSGYYSSHSKRDSGINNSIIGGFDFTRGLISCAQLKTMMENGKMFLKKRLKYGMCGFGHWARRKTDRYGHEVLTDFEPGMKL